MCQFPLLSRSALMGALVLAGSNLPSRAATFSVSNLNDSGPGSLRQALVQANARPDADVITFTVKNPAKPSVTIPLTGIITLTSGQLVVNQNVTIAGPGANRLTVSGKGASRILLVKGTGVIISGLTLANGRVVGASSGTSKSGGAAYGGALYNTGKLALSHVTFSANSAVGGAGGILYNTKGPDGGEARGGAIFNVGTLSLSNVSFQSNSATGGAGGYGADRSGTGGRPRYPGGNGGNAVGGALFNGGILTQRGVAANNTVTGGAAGYRGTPGAAIEPNVHNVMPTAVSATFSLGQERAFNTQLQAKGDLITYSTTPLPAGLTLNSSTGVIAGTPMVAGKGQKARFTVSDGFRTSAPVILNFDILPAEPKSLIVTTLSDEGNNTDGLTSLREAVAYANTKPGADTITFNLPASASTSPLIKLTHGPLTVPSDSLTVEGPGAGLLTIESTGSRIWSTTSGAMLALRRLRMMGSTDGAVSSEGTLTLTDCVLNNNASANNNAGGITCSGTTTLNRCTLSGNKDGAITNYGRLTLTNSTLYGNTDTFLGSAITSSAWSSLTIDSCTITGNFGGYGSLCLFMPWEIKNSLVVGNTEEDSQTAPEGSHSIMGVTAKAAGLETDSKGVPVLKNNGGLTPTVALRSISPAINTGATGLTLDQRGLLRPSGVAADIGAFEYQSVLSSSHLIGKTPANSAPAPSGSSS